MNHPLYRPNPALRSTYELHRQVAEIHAFTRDWHDQADIPTPPSGAARSARSPEGAVAAPLAGAPSSAHEVPPAAGIGAEENRKADAANGGGVPTTDTVAPVQGEQRTGISTSAMPSYATLALPPVVDLRPALAALTGALKQQSDAILGALRQGTEFCKNVHVQVDRISREQEGLARRVNTLVQRP